MFTLFILKLFRIKRKSNLKEIQIKEITREQAERELHKKQIK